jgi:hypothetical protein
VVSSHANIEKRHKIMRFNVRLHNGIPEGFAFVERGPSDNTDDREDPRIQSAYKISNDSITMYGLTTAYTHAYLNTKYKRGLLGRRISDQNARLDLAFSTTFDGYESTESQAVNATVGSSLDPEKAATALKICEALKEKFKILGYKCIIKKNLQAPEIQIHLGDQHSDPLKEFHVVFKELKAIEAAYERGEKPLGDIEEPRRTIKLNKRHRQTIQPSVEPVVAKTEAEEPDNKWQQLTQQRMVQGIKELAERFFPVGGEPVTDTQHQLFEAELRDFLSRGK